MGQAERPTCPGCGAFLILALPPGGKGQRTFQCFECDGPRSAEIRQGHGLATRRATAAKIKLVASCFERSPFPSLHQGGSTEGYPCSHAPSTCGIRPTNVGGTPARSATPKCK